MLFFRSLSIALQHGVARGSCVAGKVLVRIVIGYTLGLVFPLRTAYETPSTTVLPS